MDLSPNDDHFQGRLLHQAALWDNVELLEELLSSGADVDALDHSGRSALHAAALAERSRCLQALLRAGARTDLRSDPATGGKTALHIAASRGHVENVSLLIAAGAQLGLTDERGLTALQLAEDEGHRHACAALRDAADAQERLRLSQYNQLLQLVQAGDPVQLQSYLASLGPVAELVVNLTPQGSGTLLVLAVSGGVCAVVKALLTAGADGRAHPVTKYGPLYVACYHGHLDIARLLLLHFPEAVQQETVEKWLPLHAACIGGHAAVVSLLLEYPYPEALLTTYTDSTGKWQYKAAFDVNARDASGQTALYIACTLSNLTVCEALLSYSVRVVSVTSPTSEEQPASATSVVSPHRAGISLGIHAIVSKLTGGKTEQAEERTIRPVQVDITRNGDSCLAQATRTRNLRLVRRLLQAGAQASAPCHMQSGESSSRVRARSSSAGPRAGSSSPSPHYGRNLSLDKEGPWTALALAVYNKDVHIAELLLQHGATDPHCVALAQCARHELHDLRAAILATKAYPDPDYKLNKSVISEQVFTGRESDPGLTYSALCPATPVVVSWRELRCQLTHIRMSWLRMAALRVNSKLSSTAGALHSLTRIDLSNNELRLLAPELFSLVSLRYLNVAQNKLERLPAATEPFEEDLDSKGKLRRGKKPREVYTAPALQELYLQDNRLEELPPELFSLPALGTLDVSNNKLRAVPRAVWRAPALRELNAALNHLRDLPAESQPQPVPRSPSLQSPSAASSRNSQFNFNQSASRSPSIEQSESSPDDDGVVVLDNTTVWSEVSRPHLWRGGVERVASASGRGASLMQSLNLSHNQFTALPPTLACAAPNLTRLNMAYNSLRSMSYVTSYPTSLRQLDLSHNEITCWPSLPQVENLCSSEGDPLACYCPSGTDSRSRPRSGGSVRSQLLAAACPARRHLRLEGLRTLILSNNLLTRIQLTTDDDGETTVPEEANDDDDDEWGATSKLKSRLLFPLLSMLDVSCNLLRVIPPSIHELTNLAVFNISGNKDITDLPPQMGLLSRLWNLGTVGCSLGEPLASMLRAGHYKSMDIVGYLRSVLQEARVYTRMKLMLCGVQGIGKTSLLECLRQESAIQHRRKPTEHWAKRMGNKSSRRNMSTVGVDIGTWTYDKQRSSRGPVTFRTWDFGGQQEYYATHQYFLSRRSLYLVLWKVTDGRKGLAGALNWLRSIQARAPGSPVIMVATHYDQVANSNLPESESPEALQRLIRSSIMGAPDADKLGLPRVLDSVEVSCSTRHNIRLLADIIYSVAFSVKPPGSKEPLLEQRIPATYIALEECVTALACELREPVLKHDEYKRLVTQYMQQKNHRMFRDAAELHQATMFLHENGVLLHYDDATLKELYFLKPQWLCDVLAHVVTVREINPFANNGIMKIEDLAHVFKASPQLTNGDEASSLGVSLLNKFELALCWDSRILLVPPLLPQREPDVAQLPLKSRSWSSSRGTPRRAWVSALAATPEINRHTDSPTLIQESTHISISGRGSAAALRRLLLVSYVPCGFWSRLTARLLADTRLAAASRLYSPPREMELDESVTKLLDLDWGWKLWKTGLKLSCGDLTLMSLRELPARRDVLLGPSEEEEEPLYHDLRLRVKQEGSWCTLDVQGSACIEILLPAQICVAKRDDGLPISGYQSISLEPHTEALAKVLALVSDHVDLLLEDWYPSLGTRFVHTSEGRCLITRVVPCPYCLRDVANYDHHQPPQHNHHDHVSMALRRLEGAVEGDGDVGGEREGGRRGRGSQESRASDRDSGVGHESNASSRLGSVEGVVSEPEGPLAHGWTVEQCVLAACTNSRVACHLHGPLSLRHTAPDTLFLDLPSDMIAQWSHITRRSVAGRGAFGTVLGAVWSRPGHGPETVALKALQPVPPPGQDLQALHAYKAAVSRWERDPCAGAVRAYSAARQEIHVLLSLRHAHVLQLRAACVAPLALLLPLAPQGALDGVLRAYRSCSVRVSRRAGRALALQVARALEYLHARRIVYRDLKSENVLVWAMPAPDAAHAAELSAAPVDVHVKLGDYGISRTALPSGTKGFGGTEGFMAPEIMRYNGEEEYNEKVDCFSFGMLLYEIVTLRQPFEGHEAVKECVLEGGRPSLSPRDLEAACCVVETMRHAWLPSPARRPSAAALVCVCAAPEFTALQDVAMMTSHPYMSPTAAAALPVTMEWEEGAGWEIWYGGEPERAHALLATRTAFTQQHTLRLPAAGESVTDGPVRVTAMCRVATKLWLGDNAGRVSVYSASTCSLLWSVSVQQAVGGGLSQVSALLPLTSLQRVALALDCGRLFLVTSQQPEAEGGFVLTELGTATQLSCLAAVPTPHGLFLVTSQQPEAEGGFVLTELGTATQLSCLAAVPTPHGFEVWAGGDGLHAYAVSASGVCSAESLSDASHVTLLAASDTEPYLVAYCDPGVCVYQWSVRTRTQTARLDCSKLAPCSESLQSISIDEHISEEKCRVTALAALRGRVYVGTAWGCLIVADAISLSPLTVFRPYDGEVGVILPLQPQQSSDIPQLVTLGAGYRPLLQRFAAQANTNAQQTYKGTYCLLWNANHWLPD